MKPLYSSPKLCKFFAISGERQVLGIEAFNLLNAGSGVLGEVEDVDLAV